MISIFTIGHSTYDIDRFFALLAPVGIDRIVDVRSAPMSRWRPHFNRQALSISARNRGLDYVFAGVELGGRPGDPRLFKDGVANYEAMRETSSFLEGIAMVIGNTSKSRQVLMCSEKAPEECHRCLLVGRALHEKGVDVQHILGDGHVVSQASVEGFLTRVHVGEPDMFSDTQADLVAAYRMQARRHAFRTTKM